MDTISSDLAQHPGIHVSLVIADNIHLQVSFQDRPQTDGPTAASKTPVRNDHSISHDLALINVHVYKPPPVAQDAYVDETSNQLLSVVDQKNVEAIPGPQRQPRPTSEQLTQTLYNLPDAAMPVMELGSDGATPPCPKTPRQTGNCEDTRSCRSPRSAATAAAVRNIPDEDSGSDTEPEDDPIHDAYMLGYWDGHGDGRQQFRKEALRRLEKVMPNTHVEDSQEGYGAAGSRQAAATPMEPSVAEWWSPSPGQSLSRSPSPQTYVPPPNMQVGCALSPRTRKRIKKVLPPSPEVRRAVKKFKKSLAR
ncbi:hypothetical protein C8Q78DRAFT_1083897 [Trametes maxima]|nr:hypothetical protein C8Q78DRAFT_1083897 [Trametes maxima]